MTLEHPFVTLALTHRITGALFDEAIIRGAFCGARRRLYFMGSLIRRGGFVSAFSKPMTHDCEWLTVADDCEC